MRNFGWRNAPRLWNAKPENRHLPSALEWANIRLLTRKKDWTEPQRKMMKRAGRVHGLRTSGVGSRWPRCLPGSPFVARSIENSGATQAARLWSSESSNAETPQVPDIVGQCAITAAGPILALRSELRKEPDDSRQKLHASLALLPVDAAQVDYLFDRLKKATPNELPVLRDALKAHRSDLTPKLWTVLESAKPGDPRLLPSASALASYAPDDGKWDAIGGKVAQALVAVDAILLGPWIEALRPVRAKLTVPLATIFQDKDRSESEHKLATNILANYASDDPDRLAELLMVADPKAYLSLFPVAEKRAEQVLPVLQAELAKSATYSWNDPPLDPSWTKPEASLVSQIESAQGILAERFAFCQTMPLDEFLATAEALRQIGIPPRAVSPIRRRHRHPRRGRVEP